MGKMKEVFMQLRQEQAEKDKYLDDAYHYDKAMKEQESCRDCGGTGAVPSMPDGEPVLCETCQTKKTAQK